MSVNLMNDVWKGAPHSGGVFSVFLALADNADDRTGYCFPGQEYLAWKTRQTKRNVQSCLKQLSDEDWITIVLGAGENGSNGYYINMKRIAVAAIEREREFKEEQKKRRDEKISMGNPYRETKNSPIAENLEGDGIAKVGIQPPEACENFHLTIMNHHEPSDLKPSAPSVPGVSPRKSEELDIIERAFGYYCKVLGRDLKRYSLTPKRREKALMRLRERSKIVGQLEACKEIACAIQNLAASDYHRSSGYIDWIDHIFGSSEIFEKRLNWTPPAGISQKQAEHEVKVNDTVRNSEIARERLFGKPREEI